MVMMVDMVLPNPEATDCLLGTSIFVFVVDEHDSMGFVEAVPVHKKEEKLEKDDNERYGF